ncbi:hypothetical protein D3C87_2070050 [compost metagenome]
MEAQPEAEAIRQRYLFFDRFARIDRRGALILDHVARHQVAAVGGGVEKDIVRTPFETAVEDGLE